MRGARLIKRVGYSRLISVQGQNVIVEHPCYATCSNTSCNTRRVLTTHSMSATSLQYFAGYLWSICHLSLHCFEISRALDLVKTMVRVSAK